MSCQTALQFIQQLRGDRHLKERLFAIDRSPQLEHFVRLGAAVGFHFTVADPEAAHKHD